MHSNSGGKRIITKLGERKDKWQQWAKSKQGLNIGSTKCSKQTLMTKKTQRKHYHTFDIEEINDDTVTSPTFVDVDARRAYDIY